MARSAPNVYRGFEAACVFSDRTGLFYGQVINLPRAVVPFVFRRMQDFGPAMAAAVERYRAECRFAGQIPEKPIPRTAAERAPARRKTRAARTPQRRSRRADA